MTGGAFGAARSDKASEAFHIHVKMTMAVVIAPSCVIEANGAGRADGFDEALADFLAWTRRDDLKNIIGEMGADGQGDGVRIF
ncbi:hypothetical protein CU669_05425 [Paramagnetospirillum kuznetsovii]|uniref:Uncharacterized protein n=1 Tax=Paramagnetospirillum kuznetsovii TaxID=2053833 RepID=A0A364P0F5_9PROT|nr:hypothetical protein CU669_05425 [Paramagnetospirillum kuznetsovii]